VLQRSRDRRNQGVREEGSSKIHNATATGSFRKKKIRHTDETKGRRGGEIDVRKYSENPDKGEERR